MAQATEERTSLQAQATTRTTQRERESGNSGFRALGRAIAYLGRQRRSAMLAYGALIIATLSQLVVPQLVQNMINVVNYGSLGNLPRLQQTFATAQSGLPPAELQAYADNAEAWLLGAALLIVVFAATRGVFSFVQSYMAERTSQGVAFDFRNEIFSKVQRLSFSYHDRNQTGQLMIRATDDVEKVRLFIAQGLVLTAQAFLLLTATLIILLLTNWQLTLAILPILPLALVLFAAFGVIARPLFGELQRRLSALNTILQENMAGLKVVRAFNRESFEQRRFDASTDDLFSQQLRIAQTFSLLFPLIFFVGQVGQAAILYFGGQQILGGSLTLGDYQSFNLYLIYIFLPIGQLGFIISLMSQAAVSSGRIFEILDAQNDIVNDPDADDLPPIQGQVEFTDVTFRYFGSTAPVLQNVSFKAEPGQTIALLGGTGSGKTTIINLIPRFYDVSEGAVLIDNIDVRDVCLDSLRSQIGIVLQETNLFSGTIRENIAFGRPEATQEEIEAAARAAAAHDFIVGFPNSYDTPVGERGATLSGGQKQRIAIARALLLNPRILILDDSTSSVDLQTEAKIQQALDLLMEGRTSFVIAQRISTVLNADQILVLEKGQICAMGKHADLLEHSPVYAEIYNSQLIGDTDIDEPSEIAAASSEVSS
ncbi:MAG: ABC transporter ATP-binding protein [Chloroflexi bacterium]|nr:ABC transporter ATP-binding protein [Chloroflexota bacterium]